MRWSASVGAWTRWDTLLAAAAAIAAAGAAFAERLGIAWPKTAGVIAAVAFAIALLVVKVGKARVEAGRERAEADRRLWVPVAPISEIDPHLIGVDRAVQTVSAGKTDTLDAVEIARAARGLTPHQLRRPRQAVTAPPCGS